MPLVREREHDRLQREEEEEDDLHHREATSTAATAGQRCLDCHRAWTGPITVLCDDCRISAVQPSLPYWLASWPSPSVQVKDLRPPWWVQQMCRVHMMLEVEIRRPWWSTPDGHLALYM